MKQNPTEILFSPSNLPWAHYLISLGFGSLKHESIWVDQEATCGSLRALKFYDSRIILLK